MIVFKDISTGYRQPLFSEFKKTLKAPQLIVLMGANGSGKSTLFKSMAGQIPFLKGSVSYKDITNTRPQQFVSYASTQIQTYGNTTFFDLIAHGRMIFTGLFDKLSSEDIQVINSCLKQMDIINLKNKPLQEASDGERQKGVIARALATEKPVLLLDEPTAFLDYPSKLKLLKALTQMSVHERRYIFLSSHDPELAQKFADDIWLIREGKIWLRSESRNFDKQWKLFLSGEV